MSIEEQCRPVKNRLEHLNLVPRTIRQVNALITREKDPDRLLQAVCDNLIENRGYHNTWIALLDSSGKFLKAVHAGLGADFPALVDQLKRGELTHCAHYALEHPKVIVTENPLCDCPDCPLARKYAGRGAMTVRLAHAGRIFGFLLVSIPRDLALDAEEQDLFSEVANDISLALHGIDLEAARNEAVVALQESEEKLRKISSSAQDAIIMIETKEAAEAATRAKSEFLANHRDPRRVPPTDIQGLTVLVVDDCEASRTIIRKMLNSFGFRVDTVSSGPASLTLLAKNRTREKPFELVILDWLMPEMDGYDATRSIRRDPRFTDLPIIAMTAHAMKGDDEKCLAAGMDDYIAKPIHQDRLFHTLWKAVKHRASQSTFAAQSTATPPSESTPARGAPTNALPAALPGINIRETLTALAIDPDTFRRILLRFARENTDTLPQLKTARDREDWEVLQQLAHCLNGSAANIGATGLKDAAQALEAQCREKAPSESLVHQLEIALNQVLQSIQTLADPAKTAPIEKPKLPIAPQQSQPLFAPLAKALELADPEAIETQLQVVRQYLDTTQFQNLGNQIGAYDYDEALKTLKGIADKIFESA